MLITYDSDRLCEQGIEKIKNDPHLSPKNKCLILNFSDYLIAKGTSKLRISTVYFPKLRKISTCNCIGRHRCKPLDKLTRTDIEKIMAKVEASKYAPGTKNHFVTIFKVLFRWLHGLNPDDPAPPIVAWLRNRKTHSRVTKEDLLTIPELQSLISATTDPMWRCLISFLWETACRPGELRSITIKDVNRMASKYIIWVRGKTEKVLGRRKVWVYKGYPLLTTWLHLHPNSSDPEAPLFTLNGKNPITHAHLLKQIKRLAKKSNIQKRVYPYLFRHTRLTEQYSKLGHLQTQKFAGHSNSSRMISHYFHMNDDDLEAKLDEQEGITPQQPESSLECPRCHKPHSLEAQVCPHCSLVFTLEAAIQQDNATPEKVNELIEFMEICKSNPAFMKLFQNQRFQADMLESHLKKTIHDKLSRISKN